MCGCGGMGSGIEDEGEGNYQDSVRLPSLWICWIERKRKKLMNRNYDIEFPEKPKRKPFNYTAIETRMPDMNDIYTGRYGRYYGHRHDDEEYEAKLEIYSGLTHQIVGVKKVRC
jgi:hypothetical protein